MDKTKKIIGISIVVLVISVIILIALEMSNVTVMRNDAEYDLAESSMPNEMPDFASESKAIDSVASPRIRMIDAGVVPEVSDNKIIKTGSLNLKVDSADSATEKISQIAIDNDGEVFSSNFSQSSKNIKSGTITIKVPVNNFEKTFAEIKTVATLVVHEAISGTDVTMEYIDLQIQIKNKQAEEQAFVSILDRAGKIEDVLAVTREVSRVRREIESLHGRINFLESQTDKSSIDVFLTEDENITFTDSWRPWQVVKETFNGLLKDIQNFINFAIILVFRIIPTIILYVLILGLLYWLGRKIYFKVKR